MTFANPLLLWALPLGLIPIVIYYLLRFRSLSVTWGANYVLELALARLKKNLHLDQIILMALRVLACLLIVLAFARPVLRKASATVAGSGIHHILIVDGSYSMLAGSPGHRRWDAAQEVMKRLVATWGRGEAWSLLFLGDTPRWVVDGQTIQSPEEALARLDALHPGESASSLAGAFTQVAQKFPRGRAEIFVLADDQATTWAQMERAGLPAELDAPVYWLNPSGEPRPNLAVMSLRPAADRVLMDNPCRVQVSVKNFSTVKAEDVNVELLVDGVFAARQSLSLLPNQESPIHFDVKFQEPGSHYLCAQIPEDALDFDNRLFAGVEVAEQLTVVELRDAGRAGKFDSTWGSLETLERARTMTAKASGSDSTRGQIIWKLLEGPVDAAALAGADAVLLDGGRKVTPELAATLRAYVQHGGGLVLAADPGVDTAAWNHALGDAGLLPAKLGQLRSESLGGDRFRSLGRSDIAASPLRLFETDEAGDLSHARFYTWFDLESPRADAVTLLRFEDHVPWAVRAGLAGDAWAQGRGRVLLLSSGLAGQGNNLIVREFFLPLLYQLFEDAAAAQVYPRTVARGEPVRLLVNDAAELKGVTFARQGQDAAPIATRPVGGAALAEINDPTLESGLYSTLTLRGGEGRRTWFGIQGQRTDSDLTPLSPTQLAAVTQRLKLTQTADWPQLEQALQKERSGQEWQSWAALAAAAFLVGEMLFQRRFAPERPRKGRGLPRGKSSTSSTKPRKAAPQA